MSNSKSSSSGGLGICGILTIIFVVLKVTGTGAVAAWSWWWVLSPLWIGALLGLGFLILFLVFAGIVAFFNSR